MFNWSQEKEIAAGSLFRKSKMTIVITQDIPQFQPTRKVAETREFINSAGMTVNIELEGEKRVGCNCDHPVMDVRINQMLMSLLSNEEYLPFPKLPIEPPHLYRQSALTREMEK